MSLFISGPGADPYAVRRDEIDLLIAVQAGQQPWKIPLLRAARDGRIALTELYDRHAALPLGKLNRAARSQLILLGDDDYKATGPSGWAAWPNVGRWPRYAIVHAAGATVAHYSEAVRLAVAHRRLLLIETSGAQAAAWSEALVRLTVPHTLILPEDQHPKPLPAGKLQ